MRPTVNWSEMPVDQLILGCTTSPLHGAWDEFMRRYHAVVTSAAIRVARNRGNGTSEEIDDVVQEIYLKLCADHGRILREFRSSQPDAIFGFIKVVATNTARDFFRQKTAGKRGAAQTETITDMSERIGLANDLDRRLTLAELQRLLFARTQHENGARDRAIFQFYYRDGMTASAIAQLPGVGLNPKGVEGVLHRLTRALREAVINAQELGAS
jgi:RNA polymerase sigma-70 factor (ECF subfamily)